ncbi:MAG: hypothetical protein QXW55_04315 [Candidatus Bathyarchaeia archaeon]
MSESKILEKLLNDLLKLTKENINEDELREKVKEEIMLAFNEYVRTYSVGK